MKPVEFGFARRVGILLFGHGPDRIDTRTNHQARVKSEAKSEREKGRRHSPRQMRLLDHREVGGEHKGNRSRHVTEQVVAGKDGADDLAGLGELNYPGKDCGSDEKGEEDDSAKPACDALQVQEQGDYHIGCETLFGCINGDMAWKRPAADGGPRIRRRWNARRLAGVPRTASTGTRLHRRSRRGNPPAPGRYP